jgi:mannosyltransferase
MLDTARVRSAPAWPAAPAQWRWLPGAIAGTGMLALAAVTAAYHAHALGAPLWMDEGISIGIASHPLSAIPGLLRQDGSPPLYYVLLHLWMALAGRSESATHVLSLLFLALAVPAAVWAAWSPFGPLAGVLAGALVGLDPFLAYYADETRMYSLVLLLALLATGSFVRAFVLRRRLHVAVFPALLAALLYTHNWGLFYAAASALAFLGLLAAGPDRRGLLRDGAMAFAGAAALYAPWLPTLAFQAGHTGAPWSHVPDGTSLRRAVTSIWSGQLPETIVLLVAAGGIAEVIRRGRPAQRRATLAVLVVSALTLLIAYEWSRRSSPAWAVRYLVIVAAPLVIAVAAGLGRFRIFGAAAVALALLVSWHGHPSVASLAHKSNVKTIAAALGPLVPAGGLVVTTQPEQVPALRYYLGPRLLYVTPLGVVEDPQVMDWRDAVKRLRAGRFTTVMAPILRRLRAGARVLFVGPVFARPDSAWSRLIRHDTRLWRRALRRRLRVVASARPKHGSSRSSVAGVVLAVR